MTGFSLRQRLRALERVAIIADPATCPHACHQPLHVIIEYVHHVPGEERPPMPPAKKVQPPITICPQCHQPPGQVPVVVERIGR